jgi:hypothetical protein
MLFFSGKFVSKFEIFALYFAGGIEGETVLKSKDSFK